MFLLFNSVHMISALAKNESALSSDLCRHLYKARSANSYFFSKSIWPQWPPKISMIRWIDLRSLTINSDWWSCSFWNADPVQFSIKRVARSVCLEVGHASSRRATFCWYTCKSSLLGSNVGTRMANWLVTFPPDTLSPVPCSRPSELSGISTSTNCYSTLDPTEAR